MKTTIKNFPEIKDLTLDEAWLRVSIEKEAFEKELEKELGYFVKKHGTSIDAPADHGIEKEDIVMLRAKSELPKFNKPMIPVSVGKGLFNEKLEEALIGMKAGEEKSLEIDGSPVSFTVLKIKTKTIPPMSWELIKDDVQKNFPDINSVEEFEEMMRGRLEYMHREDYFFANVYEPLVAQILERSELYVDEDELQAYKDAVRESDELHAQSYELSRFDYYREHVPEWAGMSDEAIEADYDTIMEKDFRLQTYARALFIRDELDGFDDTYEDAVKAMVEESGETEERVRQLYSKDDFLSDNAVGVVNEKLMILFFEQVQTDWI